METLTLTLKDVKAGEVGNELGHWLNGGTFFEGFLPLTNRAEEIRKSGRLTKTRRHFQPVSLEDHERRYHPEKFLAQDIAAAIRTASPAPSKTATAAAPAKGKTVTVLTVKDLAEQVQSTKGLDEVVKGMLPARSVNILGGDSGLGKSPLLCQMAVCVAAGLPFLGHATKKSPVLIADYENDGALLGMLQAVASAVGAPDSIFEDGSVTVLQRPEQADLIETVRQAKPRLVIVDSLRGLNPRAESPKSTEGPQMIADLQDVDACWLILHHLRKQPADNPRAPLEDDDNPVLTWLESLAGCRALVNQTFTRLAVDHCKKADLVLRGFYKGRGEFGPIYIKRILDDDDGPIGYAELAGVQRLTLNQAADFRKLVGSLTFRQVSEILGHDQKAARLIRVCRDAGLVTFAGKGKDKLYTFAEPESPKPRKPCECCEWGWSLTSK